MGIIIEDNISDDQINNLIEDLTKDSVELRFISMSRTSANTSINIDLKPNDFKDLTKITGKINKAISKFKNNFSTEYRPLFMILKKEKKEKKKKILTI